MLLVHEALQDVNEHVKKHPPLNIDSFYLIYIVWINLQREIGHADAELSATPPLNAL